MALENQRYGRNKSTLVNKTYIDSGEYKRKFDNATDNPKVNKALYDSAKAALKHRSGTEFEDMYWIDGITGEVILAVTDSSKKRSIVYSDKIKSTISKNDNIVTLHTHPSSMPPSIEDFNSCCSNGYKMGYVACHNGKVFEYSSEQIISDVLYNLSIAKYVKTGFSEYEAQVKTLEEFQKNYIIHFKEVTSDA